MNYKLLLTDELSHRGWNIHRLRKEASLPEVAQAVVLKALLRPGYLGSYEPQELGAEGFVSDVLKSMGTSIIEMKNLKYGIHVSVSGQADFGYPAKSVSENFIQATSEVLAKNKNILPLYNDMKSKLRRSHDVDVTLGAIGLILGASPLVIKAFWLISRHDALSFLISDSVCALPAGLGLLMYKASSSFSDEVRKKVLEELEQAASPIIQHAWIDAARECGPSRIIFRQVLPSRYFGPEVELTPENRSVILESIDLATNRGCPFSALHGLGFGVDVHVDHPDLSSNYIRISVMPDSRDNSSGHAAQTQIDIGLQARRGIVTTPVPVPHH